MIYKISLSASDKHYCSEHYLKITYIFFCVYMSDTFHITYRYSRPFLKTLTSFMKNSVYKCPVIYHCCFLLCVQ